MDPYYCHQKSTRGGLWGAFLFTLGILLAFASPSANAAISTRIVAINGTYAYDHQATIEVRTGDVVALMADDLDLDGFGGAIPQNRQSVDFIWSSDIRSNDFCAPAWDCTGSNFEDNQYGVNFYVPADMPARVTLTVLNRTTGSYDQITLTRYVAPIVQNPGGQYDDNSGFDPDSSLGGYGRWVYINGSRVFVPYHYQDSWSPYTNGYWYYSDVYGWVWYSYDPWGWVTDHYGYWRHHGIYGWIWILFDSDDYYWHPHCVSFYHSDDYIGWSPYYAGYSHGYHHGYNDGYDDGYWDGYNAGLNAGYNHGTVFVQNNQFTTINVYNIHVTNVTIINQNVITAIHNNYYGPQVGSISGQVGPVRPIDFVKGRGNPVVETPVSSIPRPMTNGGHINVVRPATPVALPAEYQQASHPVVTPNTGRPIPVGSTVKPGAGTYVPPSSGTAVPPRRGDGTTVPPVAPKPPVTPRPLPAPMPAPQPAPGPGPRPIPQPQPAPVPGPRPQPQPMPQPQPAPVPGPRPVPAPQPMPQPQPAPVPGPRPQPQPMPQPQPAPMPGPRPIPQPQPMPQPGPRPQPQPMPQPAPAPRPMPQPMPAPRPEPRPMPQPAPAPRPEPRPMPQPAPRPEPRPMPQPAPRPMPAPAPQPMPGPRPHGLVELIENRG